MYPNATFAPRGSATTKIDRVPLHAFANRVLQVPQTPDQQVRNYDKLDW
jgi:hypothetical protein